VRITTLQKNNYTKDLEVRALRFIRKFITNQTSYAGADFRSIDLKYVINVLCSIRFFA